MVQISGTLRFPPRGEPLDVARVSVTVRDITELDGPARTVAQLDLPAVHVPPDGVDVPFTVDADLADPARTFALRAHADVTGSGSVTAGDLVTTTTHVVHANHQLLLPLEQIR
ncbi:MAG: YbaY family lipoprotein [Pseudonocardiaceae bacterium]